MATKSKGRHRFVLLHYCCCIRSLSPELQEDIVRLVANGNMLLKTAKPFMPGIAGLGPRSGLSQQQIAGLPAGLNSQVRYYCLAFLCIVSCVCLQCFDTVGWSAERASGL